MKQSVTTNLHQYVVFLQLEQEMETIIDVRAQKELVLLHKEDADYPKGTVNWLNARGWCSSHHHIRCPKRVFSKRSHQKIVSP